MSLNYLTCEYVVEACSIDELPSVNLAVDFIEQALLLSKCPQMFTICIVYNMFAQHLYVTPVRLCWSIYADNHD